MWCEMSKSYCRKDHFYKRAKDEGYRSRAAYKLFELNDKYHLFSKGDSVLDLGSWPGGWLQVAAEVVGEGGVVVGIDLVQINPLPFEQVKFVSGDACEDDVIKRALEFADGQFDVVISDMSPKLTGIREVDEMAVVGCAELAFSVVERSLRKGGAFAIKLFKGNDVEAFFRSLRPSFNRTVRTELKSSRDTSNEFYCIGLGFK